MSKQSGCTIKASVAILSGRVALMCFSLGNILMMSLMEILVHVPGTRALILLSNSCLCDMNYLLMNYLLMSRHSQSEFSTLRQYYHHQQHHLHTQQISLLYYNHRCAPASRIFLLSLASRFAGYASARNCSSCSNWQHQKIKRRQLPLLDSM